MDGFSVGGFLSVAIFAAPEMPGKSARKESKESQSSPRPNLAFCGKRDTHGVFFLQNQKDMKTQKYTVRRKLHKSPMFSFPKNPCQI